MLFRSYIGSYLPSGEKLHVVKVNVQWWRYACAQYRVRPNTMAKPVTKDHVVESNVTWMDICSGAAEQAKWSTGVPEQLPLKFCIFAKRLFYKKKTRFKSSDCSAEAIRWSSWLICHCLEKSNRTHTHTHTHTHNYCNPAAHARWGLITGT